MFLECQLQSNHHSGPDEDVRSSSGHCAQKMTDFERGELSGGEEEAQVESIPTSLWEPGSDAEDDQVGPVSYPW